MIGRTITASQKPLPEQEGERAPGQEQLPHVSEEAAALGETTGEGGPELELGTPVEEILERDKKAQQNAHKVLKDRKNQDTHNIGSRKFSTTAFPRDVHQQQASVVPPDQHLAAWPKAGDATSFAHHIFPLPNLPLPAGSILQKRHDPIITQFTNLLMQNGKLSIAQRRMAIILERLRIAAPPSFNVQRPMIPGGPPPTHLPFDPISYLKLAIDSVAPLLRIRSQKGAAGGGVALQLPVPLGLKQRRRTAVAWLLEAASKRRSKSSGRALYPSKVADEIIAVVEGRSSLWEKRGGIHRQGVAARANASLLSMANAKKRKFG